MEEVITILEGQAVGRTSTRYLDLKYPKAWRIPQMSNRYAEIVEEDVIAWLKRSGLIITEAHEMRVRQFEHGYFGKSAPYANYRTLMLYARFIVLWLFWDDVLVEKQHADEGVLDIEDIAAAMQGRPLGPDACSFARAWNELCAELRMTQDDGWFRRFTGNFEDWLRNTKTLEATLAARFKAGQPVQYEEMRLCREIGIGMYPTIDLIEYMEGVPLPAALHQDPRIAELKKLASMLVVYTNELGGLAKDIRDRWPNLVTVLGHELGLPIAKAYEEIVSRHNQCVEQYDAIAAQLPSMGPRTDAILHGWLDSLRYCAYGFGHWQASSARYHRRRVAINGVAWAPRIRTYDCSSGGGTVIAMRPGVLSPGMLSPGMLSPGILSPGMPRPSKCKAAQPPPWL